MFSENQKISAGQLRALLLTDWMGKLLLLLPQMMGKQSSGNVIAGILAGTLLAAAAGWMAAEAVQGRRQNYYGRLKDRAGRRAADFIFMILIIYLLGQSSLFFYLCGQIAGTYLLPEVNKAILLLVPALLAYYLARSGLEVRGRVSEITAFFLWGLFFLMLMMALFQIHPDRLEESGGKLDSGFLQAGAYTVFAGFGTVGLLPLALPQVTVSEEHGGRRRKHNQRNTCILQKKIAEAILMSGLLLLLVEVCSYGSFGRKGMTALRWPVIALMSSTNLQGVFLQRWDILLIGFLVFCLFLSAGTGIYYLGAAGRTLGMKESHFLAVGTGLSWLLAYWMEKNPGVIYWQRNILFLVCAPILMGTAVLQALLEKSEEALWKRKER